MTLRAENASFTIVLTAAVVLYYAVAATADDAHVTTPRDDVRVLMDTVDTLFDAADSYNLAPGVRILRSADDAARATESESRVADREDDPEKYLLDRIARYAGTHILDVNFSQMVQSAGRTFNLHKVLRKYHVHSIIIIP